MDPCRLSNKNQQMAHHCLSSRQRKRCNVDYIDKLMFVVLGGKLRSVLRALGARTSQTQCEDRQDKESAAGIKRERGYPVSLGG